MRSMPNVSPPSRRFVIVSAAGLSVLLGCPEQSTPQSSAASAADAAAVKAMQASMPAPGAQQDTMPRDSIADLPRATVDVRYVAPTGQTIRVDARGNLQSALDRAKPGDVVRLASGATYVGNFVLPTKRCGTPDIIVRTDVADSLLPPEGQRITPTFAPRLAKIATANDRPAIRTTNPTCGWRLHGARGDGDTRARTDHRELRHRRVRRRRVDEGRRRTERAGPRPVRHHSRPRVRPRAREDEFRALHRAELGTFSRRQLVDQRLPRQGLRLAGDRGDGTVPGRF